MGQLLVSWSSVAIMQCHALLAHPSGTTMYLQLELCFLLVVNPSKFYKSLKSFSLVVAGLGALLNSFLKGWVLYKYYE